ncbi:nck-associated protein 5-like [Anguilla anguilla]|uniref:nck-associated protein 5-like n=1 Tax=Anguilla anguilla TaxID=7936 RepID=UPI0015A7CE33|nr:nck-associated protein 5-like [Anguilla anguilla]
MSEEAELRECDEAFESEEGDIEPYLEDAESSRELLERLRELEAENSALALANESQREAYERCLDEVANHVVQALLNQKDLREECIKLKMRVFDLERQNRTLTELFHQKLHSQPSSLQQMPLVPFPEHSAEPLLIGQDKPAAVQSDGQAKSGGDRTRNGTTGTPAPPSSMEALSPFFKKKAHILEVLRKLEESDPLKFHPSTGLPSYPDLGQALVPEEAPLARGGSAPPQPRCRHSCSDSDLHEYANGEGASLREERDGCPPPLPLTRKSLESVLQCGREPAAPRPARRGADPAGGAASPSRARARTVPEERRGASPGRKDSKPARAQANQSGAPSAGLGDSPPPEDPMSLSPPEGQLSGVTDLPLSTKHTEGVAYQGLSSAGQVAGTEDRYLEVAADAADVEGGSSSATSNAPARGVTAGSRAAYRERDGEDQVCNGLCLPSGETPLPLKAVERSAAETEAPPAGKSKLSPTSPSCVDEAKGSPVSSPSRLLKFLKIPSIGERAQAANPLRLSPQLTRSSKIPCRNNNYEVYHSPVLARKATTAERDRQPPSSKADPYPATHSAPTSPPKPEDAGSPVAREVSYSSHSAPKSSRGAKLAPSSQPQRGLQKVPHYENVSDLSCPAEGGAPQFLDRLKGPHFLPYPQSEDPADGHASTSEEKSLDGLSPPAANPPCEQDQESAIWYKIHNHHSLPSSSGFLKAQSSPNYSSMRDKQHDRGAPDTAQPGSEPVQSQSVAKRSDPPSIPKKPTAGKSPSESGHHPFKERLAALGKLKSSEDLPVGPLPVDRKDLQCGGKVTSGSGEKSKTAERQADRGEHRHSKYTDSLDGKPYPKASLASYAVKFPGPCAPYEPGAKSSAGGSSVPKAEQETFPPRAFVAKAEGAKYRAGLPSAAPDPPQVLRNYMKCAAAQNLPPGSKAGPSPQSSPTKVPSKSPSKPGPAPSGARGPRPVQDDRAAAPKPSPRTEDKGKLTAGKKKSYGESLPPPPPRPPEAGEERKACAPCPQSAIEQKVMKGIEENVLKLQEQDRGQAAEVKQKASNGIASWFGLRKSKLPALSRKPEMSKLKLNVSSAAKDPKAATKKKLEVESLNISKLMEKAEDLRKALEEERAYVNGVALDRPGRGHSCEVVMDQAQGQLSVMYRGVASDNFMQQLLNRVDERDPGSFGLAHRRLSFDSKKSRPVIGYQRNGISHARSREEMGKGSDLVSKEDIASEESLAESMGSQHFAGSGASMRTLDSGIGTFPLPDYVGGAAGKSIPKARPQGEQESASHGKPGLVTKVPRKARTLERELSSLEEANPSALYGASLEGRGPSILLSSTIHEDVDAYGAHMRSPPSKNWTFPNLKASTGPADIYLGVKGEVEPAAQGSPFRQGLKPCVPVPPRDVEAPGLALPPQMGLSRRGKGRTPSASEVGKEGGLELVKERPDDILSPSRPQALETPESLSDSLYDSLSSCGSQG